MWCPAEWSFFEWVRDRTSDQRSLRAARPRCDSASYEHDDNAAANPQHGTRQESLDVRALGLRDLLPGFRIRGNKCIVRGASTLLRLPQQKGDREENESRQETAYEVVVIRCSRRCYAGENDVNAAENEQDRA